MRHRESAVPAAAIERERAREGERELKAACTAGRGLAFSEGYGGQAWALNSSFVSVLIHQLPNDAAVRLARSPVCHRPAPAHKKPTPILLAQSPSSLLSLAPEINVISECVSSQFVTP